MANVTLRFGVILAILGGAFYFATHAPTSLIPLYFGIVLVLFGFLARTEDARKRMLWMHIAVTVGLLGFLFPFIRVVMLAVKGTAMARPMAFYEQALMALICFLFTALCVRSFIAARRTRG